MVAKVVDLAPAQQQLLLDINNSIIIILIIIIIISILWIAINPYYGLISIHIYGLLSIHIWIDINPYMD